MLSDIWICSEANTGVSMMMWVPSHDLRDMFADRRLRFLDSGHRLVDVLWLIKFTITHHTFCTGSVVLSGFINAARLASAAAGTPVSDQRILFFGAGSAGIGVAKQLMSFFTLLGLSEEDAKKRIYVCLFLTPLPE